MLVSFSLNRCKVALFLFDCFIVVFMLSDFEVSIVQVTRECI